MDIEERRRILRENFMKDINENLSMVKNDGQIYTKNSIENNIENIGPNKQEEDD